MDSNSTPCKPGLSAAIKARAYLRNELLIGETLYADILEEGVKVHKAHTAMKYCFPRPGLAIITSVSIPVPREGLAVNLKKENVRLFLHIQVIKRLCHTHTHPDFEQVRPDNSLSLSQRVCFILVFKIWPYPFCFHILPTSPTKSSSCSFYLLFN